VGDFAASLNDVLGADRVRSRVPLADLTTFKVGGPAEYFIETRSSDEVLAALRAAHANGVPVTLLGGGSNVLVADTGVTGLVIRPRGGEPDGVRHGPRPIDVDLLLLGEETHRSDRLSLPHEQVTSRRFVLVPLLELDPDLTLPDGRRVADALAALAEGQDVRRVGDPLTA
jgi:putative intracellular protease/amidase